MPFGKPRRSRSASSVSSQAQVMLDPGPWPGLSRLNLLHSVPHLLRVRSRQRVTGINGLSRLHGHAAVPGRALHEVPLCQSERVEDFLWDDNLAPLADAAHSAGWCSPFRLDSSARHAFSLSACRLVGIERAIGGVQVACSAAVAGIKLALHGNDRYQHRRCNDDAILPSAISEFRSLICMDKGYTLENRCRPTKMPFDWDQANTEHIARHRVTPADAEQVISGASLPIETEDRAVRNGTPSWARPTQGDRKSTR